MPALVASRLDGGDGPPMARHDGRVRSAEYIYIYTVTRPCGVQLKGEHGGYPYVGLFLTKDPNLEVRLPWEMEGGE
jgi:hypothetical protein